MSDDHSTTMSAPSNGTERFRRDLAGDLLRASWQRGPVSLAEIRNVIRAVNLLLAELNGRNNHE